VHFESFDKSSIPFGKNHEGIVNLCFI